MDSFSSPSELHDVNYLPDMEASAQASTFGSNPGGLAGTFHERKVGTHADHPTSSCREIASGHGAYLHLSCRLDCLSRQESRTQPASDVGNGNKTYITKEEVTIVVTFLC